MQTIRISIPYFLLLLACIFHSCTSNTVSFQPSTQFQQFKQTYNKTYSNKLEQSHRQQIFYNNLQKVIQLSASPDSPFGITKFMDLTEEELSLMKNSKITSPVRTVTSHFTISRKLGAPALLDWRAKGAVTAVKDQGNCGSCWAFAAAGYCQSNLIINSGYRNDIDLSQQYLLQCTPQSNCKGGYPAYALVQILTKGIPKQQTFPYSPLTKYPNICQTRKTIKVKGKQVYVYFQLNDIQLIYLLQSGPIVVGVASENWEYYRGGVMVCSSNVTEDHAVLLVGYTNQYWIVKNQWGTNWGQRGFIRISRTLGSNCLMGIQVETLSTTKLTILTTILLLVVLLIY